MKNKKGLEMSITTVTIFAVLILVLAAVSVYTFHTFGTAGAGVTDILRGTAEETEALDPGAEVSGVFKGGVCTGEPALTLCGYYYQTAGGLSKSVIRGHHGCNVPTCRLVGGYAEGIIVPNSNLGRCINSSVVDSYSAWAVCPVDCSKFTEVGKTLCECAGCTWRTS